jgi:hypothetical protein
MSPRPGVGAVGICADWDHRLSANAELFDDFGVVDALQGDRRESEMAVAELSLDDAQRHTLARRLDGVRVAQFVGREAAPDARPDAGPSQVRPRGGA